MSESDPEGGDFQKDVEVDKPGIVGARWWHQSLMDADRVIQRRQVLVGLAVTGGVFAAVAALGVGIAKLASDDSESTTLAITNALAMQKQYGWDFGARGVPLVFNGVAEGPFVRKSLEQLGSIMTPAAQGPNAKYQVATLMESLFAKPTMTLPDPGDGGPRPDAVGFRPLADVLVPVITPGMLTAYRAGEALARLAGRRPGLAALVDLPGPEAVAFAAGAAQVFEPVLLLDNWPHPHGVVPSHMTLAAMAYYQPRFASQGERLASPPLFVLDRSRLFPYSEESDRFDNRYYARMPKLQALAKDGVTALFYVVASPAALPEPADLNPVLSATDSGVQVRALALTDFESDPAGGHPERVEYGGSVRSDAGFWDDYRFDANAPADAGGSTSTPNHRFVAQPAAVTAVPPSLGQVAVVMAASGVIVAAALDRRGSMNRFAGGWSG